MELPPRKAIELPILQELAATQGEERLKTLCVRLRPYFPHLNRDDLPEGVWKRWIAAVQRAGDALAGEGAIVRERGSWRLTPKGSLRLHESVSFIPQERISTPPSHRRLQEMLVGIGERLGRYAALEFEGYDVIWRDTPRSPRISHVFEVQCRGNLASALTKLKCAYETQRSRPFLLLADERDEVRARRLLWEDLRGAFHELGGVVTLLRVGEVVRLFHALEGNRETLGKLIESPLDGGLIRPAPLPE